MAIVQLKGFKCERCCHIWHSNNPKTPRWCPACKSPYWDKPRKKVEVTNDITPIDDVK